MSWYVIILLCQIIYEALEMQILLVKYCDYLSMSNNLYGARETNIVLIVSYTLWLCDHLPYPYGFLILYGPTEINDMIWYYINFCKGNDCFLQLPALRTSKCVNNAATVQNPQTCRLCEPKPTLHNTIRYKEQQLVTLLQGCTGKL